MKTTPVSGLMTVTQRGKVILKVITNFNGENINKLANAFKKSPTVNLDELLNMAILVGLGKPEWDLIVMDNEKEVYQIKGDLDPFCRHTFHKAKKHPYLTITDSENTVIVTMEELSNGVSN